MKNKILVLFSCSKSIKIEKLEKIKEIVNNETLLKSFNITCIVHRFTIFAIMEYFAKKFKGKFEFDSLKIGNKELIRKKIIELHKLFLKLAIENERINNILPINFFSESFIPCYIVPIKQESNEISVEWYENICFVFCPPISKIKEWEIEIANMIIHNIAHTLGVNAYWPCYTQHQIEKKKESILKHPSEEIAKSPEKCKTLESWMKALKRAQEN